MISSFQLSEIILIGITIILSIWLIRQEIRISKLLRGKTITPLEDTIVETLDKQEEIKETQQKIFSYLKSLNERVLSSVQKVNIVRFDPYGEGGGKQSFALALLDENGTGVVLSTLYSRERTSVFAKPVLEYVSTHELSEEERHVIQKAKAS
jgi:hypothetical protein